MTPTEIRERLLRTLGYQTTTLDPVDVSYLDKQLLDEDGLLCVLPALELGRINPEHLRLWCHHHAVYLLPSQELIEFLREKIAGRPAIEIGAGHGSVGRALGIPITDSRMQERPEIKQHYASMNQPTITYPSDVELFDAQEAVREFEPKVVVGCWITHLYREDDHERGGNMYGVDEVALLSQVECYVHVGDAKVHAKKRINDPTLVKEGSWRTTATGEGICFGRGKQRVIQVWERSNG